MTIETLTCDKCGSTLRIETDDNEYLKERKAEFEAEHKNCNQTTLLLPAQ